MAKSNRSRRVTTANANYVALNTPFDFRVSPFPSSLKFSSLTQFEDRRQWHPEGTYAPARSFSQSRHRLVAARPKISARPPRLSKRYSQRLYSPTHRIAFSNPSRVLICVRRQQRREVLHAFRKTGRGGHRRPRYNHYSSISCRG